MLCREALASKELIPTEREESVLKAIVRIVSYMKRQTQNYIKSQLSKIVRRCTEEVMCF